MGRAEITISRELRRNARPQGDYESRSAHRSSVHRRHAASSLPRIGEATCCRWRIAFAKTGVPTRLPATERWRSVANASTSTLPMIAGGAARCRSTCAGASDDDATAAEPPDSASAFTVAALLSGQRVLRHVGASATGRVTPSLVREPPA